MSDDFRTFLALAGFLGFYALIFVLFALIK